MGGGGGKPPDNGPYRSAVQSCQVTTPAALGVLHIGLTGPAHRNRHTGSDSHLRRYSRRLLCVSWALAGGQLTPVPMAQTGSYAITTRRQSLWLMTA